MNSLFCVSSTSRPWTQHPKLLSTLPPCCVLPGTQWANRSIRCFWGNVVKSLSPKTLPSNLKRNNKVGFLSFFFFLFLHFILFYLLLVTLWSHAGSQFPDQGSNPCPAAVEVNTGPPGKSPKLVDNRNEQQADCWVAQSCILLGGLEDIEIFIYLISYWTWDLKTYGFFLPSWPRNQRKIFIILSA